MAISARELQTVEASVMTKAEVFARLRSQSKALQAFGVQRCGVFGSFVNESAVKAESDVDILVAFDPAQKTFKNFMELAFFLEALMGRSVDLVTEKSLSPYIGPHILREVEYVSTDF